MFFKKYFLIRVLLSVIIRLIFSTYYYRIDYIMIRKTIVKIQNENGQNTDYQFLFLLFLFTIFFILL